jgi:hypothetical protein
VDNPAVNKILDKINELQDEFEKGIEERRRKFRYHMEQQKVVFDLEAIREHLLHRVKLAKYLRQSKILAAVTAPVIYSLIIPLSLLDLFITLYQWICFPVYQIPRVKRREYVVMDRKYLAYLNVVQKMNCIYCEYGNGVIAYAREVASRTEQFWCPIKHARKIKGVHDRYYDFIEYGDSENFAGKVHDLRDKCRACEKAGDCPTKD